jgi:hypothetical protein
MSVKLTDEEARAIHHVLGSIMQTAHCGQDAWLGDPQDQHLLLHYDGPEVRMLEEVMRKIAARRSKSWLTLAGRPRKQPGQH